MRRIHLVPILLIAALFLGTGLSAQQPVRIGEHVEHLRDSQHPYTGSGAATPTLTWSDTIQHPGAIYIAVHFARMQLAAGDHVIVRSPDGSQSWSYTHNGRHDLGVHPDGFFATRIHGDTAVVELFTTGDNSAYGYAIDKYGRGYNAQEIADFWSDGLGEQMNLPEPPGFPESVCTANDTRNATCYEMTEPEAYEESRAVARMFINGAIHCTGWLIGNEGHIMTNEHCITSQAQLNQIDFEFMAEGDCATNCNFGAACPGVTEASGGTFIMDNNALDYALVLPDTATARGTNLANTYGYMQLRESGAVLDERIYIPQHPAGWGKQIAMESTYPQDVSLGGNTYATSITENACSGGTNDVGYWADTQGGSSGSPVLGYSDHKVVALHHCRGSSFCASGGPSDSRNRGVPIEAVITSLGANLPAGALEDPIFNDGFESGNATNWALMVP